MKTRTQKVQAMKRHRAGDKRKRDAVGWLRQTFYVAGSGCAAKAEVYAAYLSHCYEHLQEPLSRAVFGRHVVHTVFPSLESRRLGSRGRVRYHYVGLQIRNPEGHPPGYMWENFKADTQGDVKGTGKRNRGEATTSSNEGKKPSVTSSDCTTACEDIPPRNPGLKPSLEGDVGSDNSGCSVSSLLPEMLPSGNQAPFLFASLYNAPQLQTISFDQLDDRLPTSFSVSTQKGTQRLGLEEHLVFLSKQRQELMRFRKPSGQDPTWTNFDYNCILWCSAV